MLQGPFTLGNFYNQLSDFPSRKRLEVADFKGKGVFDVCNLFLYRKIR